MKRTCELCGRVGTRCWRRNTDGKTVCRNQSGCVQRMCEKLWPKPTVPGWVDLGYIEGGQPVFVRKIPDTPEIRLWDKEIK